MISEGLVMMLKILLCIKGIEYIFIYLWELKLDKYIFAIKFNYAGWWLQQKHIPSTVLKGLEVKSQNIV